MRIYFARHGESYANTLGEMSARGLKHPLTPVGRQQALALAKRLRPSKINRIFSSPILRAIETSVLIANELGIEYEVTDALREYDVGILEDKQGLRPGISGKGSLTPGRWRAIMQSSTRAANRF